MIEISQNESGSKGFFSAFDGNTKVGRISYIYAGKTSMILDHTEVNESYHGQGIGKKILMKIVDSARAKKIEIIPLCPFAKSVFDKTESIRDVLVRS